MIKKIMKDTMGVAIGSVGISQSKTIDEPFGKIIGTSMAAGLAKKVSGGLKW